MNDEILVKHMLGESDAETQQTVQDWLAGSPENERHYQQLLSAWKLSRDAAMPAHRDSDAAWERFKGRLAEQQRQTRLRPTATMRWMRAAAILLAFLSVGAILYGVLYTPMERFVGKDLTSTHAVLRDTLPDGTVVTLNKGSSIHVAPTALARRRVVNMGAGEVFFDVARNESKPFEVTVGNARITVLGTAFNIRKMGDRVAVTVSSGRVNVQYDAWARQLGAGQRVVIDPDNHTFVVDRVEDNLYQYYVENRFVLKNTPLRRVTEILSDAYGQPIRIERPELENLTLTATYERNSLEQILHVVAETLAVTVVNEGGTWVIR
ncbi:FecR domain-containing protein [Parapedobacter lycopersici]|uniref:FecR family protein n=1 Tax=Parapedobacter lycopersici TaxID=1864939 RepID=UPI00334048F6